HPRHEEAARRDHRGPDGQERRADQRRRRPRPLVLGRGGPRVRLRRSHPGVCSGCRGRRRNRSGQEVSAREIRTTQMETPTFMAGGDPASRIPQGPYNRPSVRERTGLGLKPRGPSAQLRVLESMDPDRDIMMYINSPGGSFTAMTAIYDTMQYIRPQVMTVVLGQAASAAAVIAAAGTPGKRLALPNARILIHQPAVGEAGRGQASDIEIQAKEILRLRTWLEDTLARHTNKTQQEINADI